jgi:hypothetical protein
MDGDYSLRFSKNLLYFVYQTKDSDSQSCAIFIAIYSYFKRFFKRLFRISGKDISFPILSINDIASISSLVDKMWFTILFAAVEVIAITCLT